MKYIQIFEEEKVMVGTNCSNCWATKDQKSEEVKEGDLNDQGGTVPQNDDEMKRAKESDLITMPGKGSSDVKVMCAHEKVKQWVTPRMCCAFWDAPGTKRAYGEQAVGK